MTPKICPSNTDRRKYSSWWIYLTLLFLAHCTPSRETVEPPQSVPNPHKEPSTLIYDCPAAKEYITTFNYLTKNDLFRVTLEDASQIAGKVTTGCTGAALRFIKVTQLLQKADLPLDQSIVLAQRFAGRSDTVTDGFITIFKSAFLQSKLDLPLLAAIKIAQRLSVDYNGNVGYALKDYRAIGDYCLAPEGLGQSKPFCAEFAARFTHFGERFDTQIAPHLTQLINFLHDSKAGPQIGIKNALKIAQQLIPHSPFTAPNFVRFYRFATAEKGLNLPRKSALMFAINLAKQTVQPALEPVYKSVERFNTGP